MELALRDMYEVQKFLSPKLDALGDPWTCSHRWLDFFRNWPNQWAQLLKKFSPVTTAADGAAGRALSQKRGGEVCIADSFRCPTCAAAFGTGKALAQHRRIRHGERMQARRFVGADCSCPVCGIKFASRTRVLAHLAEKRSRGKHGGVPCGSAITSGRWAPLPPALIDVLDSADRTERAAAWKRGWTQPHAEVHASRARGGRVVAPDHLPNKKYCHKTPVCEVVWSLKRRKLCDYMCTAA